MSGKAVTYLKSGLFNIYTAKRVSTIDKFLNFPSSVRSADYEVKNPNFHGYIL